MSLLLNLTGYMTGNLPTSKEAFDPSCRCKEYIYEAISEGNQLGFAHTVYSEMWNEQKKRGLLVGSDLSKGSGVLVDKDLPNGFKIELLRHGLKIFHPGTYVKSRKAVIQSHEVAKPKIDFLHGEQQ